VEGVRTQSAIRDDLERQIEFLRTKKTTTPKADYYLGRRAAFVAAVR
jgi:hypothetical protein